MKLFTVRYEEDGKTVKAPGVSETVIHQCDLHFAAESIDVVWNAIADIRTDPERRLIYLVETAPLVTVLPSIKATKSSGSGRRIMDIHSPPGTVVQYMDRNGYPGDVDHCRKAGLRKDELYEVAEIDTHGSWSGVRLKEFSGQWFNTACFCIPVLDSQA